MLQFYFLSVLLNMIAGYILMFADRDDTQSFQGITVPAIAYDETFRLVIGILTSVTGFFKLLTAVRGDIPVVGDLVPALAGLVGGFSLLYEYYRFRAFIDEETLPAFVRRIVSNQRYIGVGCALASILHFLFPSVLLL